MLLYHGLSEDFIRDADNGMLTEKIEFSFFEKYHYAPPDRHIQHLGRYLRSLAKVLDAASLRDNDVILKYQLPSSSAQLDCIITGKDAEENVNAVIIEMKNWQGCRLSDSLCEMVYDRHGLPFEILHPSVQACQYIAYLQGFNDAFQTDFQYKFSACTFLPGYEIQSDDALLHDRFHPYLEQSPIFSRNEASNLGQFLKNRLANGHGTPIAKKLLDSKQYIDKKLIQQAASLLGGTSGYVLLDEQKIAYDKIMTAVQNSLDSRDKQVIIVRGGPGTGKSVIAMTLLADLRNKLHLDAQYATGSRAFHETLTKILGPRPTDYLRYF